MFDSHLGKAVKAGLLAGIIAASVSAIGMVEAFDQRALIIGVLTLGQLMLYITPLIVGYMVSNPAEEGMSRGLALSSGLVAGLMTAVPVIGLILLSIVWPDVRDSLVNVSPALIEILTFGQGPVVGSLILAGVMAALGLLGAAFHLLPERLEKPLLYATLWTLGIGLFSEILINVLRNINTPRQVLSIFFGTNGITPLAAIIIFAASFAFYMWWESRGAARYQARTASLTEEQKTRNRRLVIIASAIFILVMPWILGIYLTEVLDIVGIFIIMGLGLNIVVGFAGLLDLGYVAFFAIGAYMMGLLTTSADLGIAGLSFWTALPFAVGTATLAGIILGIPVLRMRGDYLAIVTLGFGEIIRVLAVSDLLKGTIGGAQGILSIGKPQILSFTFVEPRHFYYLILAGVVLALFVSARLRDARLGRQWMAMREDEDVAEAMGIRLVNTKLLAFAIGATFSGLAGAIFASRIGSIFPNSFNLLISINVLSLIIVGGLGSLPGVILGAFVLVGLPELLREFSEYRLLFYGVLLIATMLLRPEGLWPSPIRQRELHPEIDVFEEDENQPDVHYMA